VAATPRQSHPRGRHGGVRSVTIVSGIRHLRLGSRRGLRSGKRIIPAVPHPLEGASPPLHLRDLNYIFFYTEPNAPGSDFGPGLTQLVEALNTDLEWLREHTRLLLRATEWDRGGRAENRLFSGNDIGAGKDWVARRPKGAPEPTALHLQFIRASEEFEDARLTAQRKQLNP
jgi:hypothetical protein